MIQFLQILQMQLIQIFHPRLQSINLIFLNFLKNPHQTIRQLQFLLLFNIFYVSSIMLI